MTAEGADKPEKPGRRARKPDGVVAPEDAASVIDEGVREIEIFKVRELLESATHKRQVEILKINAKHDGERTEADHRRQKECREDEHRRWKEKAVMFAGGLLGIACLCVIFFTRSSDTLKQSAFSGLFTLFAAALAFAAGKGSGKS